MSMQVITNSEETEQHKAKSAKSLSGGEKSFSTISLLLTLWDAINCPIRCLDEFDVFMDSVNRKIAIRMMVRWASILTGQTLSCHCLRSTLPRLQMRFNMCSSRPTTSMGLRTFIIKLYTDLCKLRTLGPAGSESRPK
jgi:hypothetical protein